MYDIFNCKILLNLTVKKSNVVTRIDRQTNLSSSSSSSLDHCQNTHKRFSLHQLSQRSSCEFNTKPTGQWLVPPGRLKETTEVPRRSIDPSHHQILPSSHKTGYAARTYSSLGRYDIYPVHCACELLFNSKISM